MIFRPILFQSLYNFNTTQPSEPLNSSVKSNLNRKNRRTRLPMRRINSNKDFCLSPSCSSINKIVIRASNLELNQTPDFNSNPYNRSTQPTINRDIRENIYNIPTNNYLEVYSKSTTNYFGSDITNEKTLVVWNLGANTKEQNFYYTE